MKQKISVLILALTMLAAGCTSTNQPVSVNMPKQQNITEVTVGKKKVIVELRDDDGGRAQGLSGRQNLAPDTGMLFDFTNTSTRIPGFWMKEMLFDIDIIWISQNKITAINRSVAKPREGASLDQLPVYYPPGEIDYVLEVPSGWSQKNKIEIGELVQFK